MVFLYWDDKETLTRLAGMPKLKVRVNKEVLTATEYIGRQKFRHAKVRAASQVWQDLKWPNVELTLGAYEIMCDTLGVCGAVIIPNPKTHVNQLQLYPSVPREWYERHDTNKVYVWIESTGRTINGIYTGGHYVTHDYTSRIEAFGKDVDKYHGQRVRP
jgi:hypothetical protein